MNLKEEEKKIKSINTMDIFNHNIRVSKNISILFKKIDNDN